MKLIAPFKALHYDAKVIGDVSKVIVPPYDVIKPDEEARYRAQSPYNFAHVILPKSADDDYTGAAEMLKKWREVGVIKEDKNPSYYLYQQTFKIDGKVHQRHTLMGAVMLRDFSEGIVRPHENTHGKYKSDRLQILRKTRCNLSHVFGMVKDPEGELQTLYEEWMYHDPFLSGATDDGIEHRVWKIDPSFTARIDAFFADKPIYIVDGHHRYESALMYAKETGAYGNESNPASRMLFAIANTYDPALLVFPTHRRVREAANLSRETLEKEFELTPATYEELREFTQTVQKEPRFGLYYWNELYFCTPKDYRSQESAWGPSLARLSVAWSDEKLLKEMCGIGEQERSKRISYEKSLPLLWDEKRTTDLVVFHAPPAVSDITDVADEKRFMPQKSTYFYPKLVAGLTIRNTCAE